MIVFWIALAIVIFMGFTAFFGAPYVPSLNKEVKAAFDELYPIAASDVVVDMGSGDGSVLTEAKCRGARVVGVELNPLLAAISRLRLGHDASIVNGNMWSFILPADTTLVYVFAVSRDLNKLEAYMQDQAERLGRPFTVMTFGATFKSRHTITSRKAHSLYVFAPLQS